MNRLMPASLIMSLVQRRKVSLDAGLPSDFVVVNNNEVTFPSYPKFSSNSVRVLHAHTTSYQVHNEP